MWQEQALLIPADHPTAAGHFPGNPIIPGALLLDAVVAAIGQSNITIRNTKFLIPTPHGTPLRLRWQGEGAEKRFECRTGDNALVMTGTLAAAP
jgi:3-hydroxymyristoyl/3-hydroxydecanoyl-(acyl carrier protein) dehydratase